MCFGRCFFNSFRHAFGVPPPSRREAFGISNVSVRIKAPSVRELSAKLTEGVIRRKVKSFLPVWRIYL